MSETTQLAFPPPGRSDEPRKVKVFACEDSRVTLAHIISGLARFGVDVSGFENGLALDAAMKMQEPDIVILDIGLPGEDGYSIAERLKRHRPHIGIIMLTARDHVDDRVKGLDCGADIYFSKPVDMRELASAIGSLHRRLSPLGLGGSSRSWRLDAARSSLFSPSGVEIALTDNELRFLSPLLEHPGEVVHRDVLLRALGQTPDMYAMRRMETLLSRLRSKVQKTSPGDVLPVRARHGRGYAFLSEAGSGH